MYNMLIFKGLGGGPHRTLIIKGLRMPRIASPMPTCSDRLVLATRILFISDLATVECVASVIFGLFSPAAHNTLAAPKSRQLAKAKHLLILQNAIQRPHFQRVLHRVTTSATHKLNSNSIIYFHTVSILDLLKDSKGFLEDLF